MLLPPKDAAMFYRAWGMLLTWVNEQRRIVPRFSPPTPDHPIEVSVANQIRKVAWAEDALREQFLAEGAGELGREERDLIASWSHRVSSSFIVLRHLRKHSIFMSEGVYGVLGIYSPLEEMIPFVPTFVKATLLPFGDVIITDGLVESYGMQLTFGGGARRSFNDQYSAARAAGEIRTALPWTGDAKAPAMATRAKARKATPKLPLSLR